MMLKQRQQSFVPQAATQSDTDESTSSRSSSSKSLSSEVGVRRVKTLSERSQIPMGIRATAFILLWFFHSIGIIYDLDLFVQSSGRSYMFAFRAMKGYIISSLNGALMVLSSQIGEEHRLSWRSVCLSTLVAAFVGCCFYVLFYGPIRAGMWTGRRATKHIFHRYLGLFYLITYACSWVEFLTDYEGHGKDSFLPLILGLNGIVQASSAFFQFRVLPDLDDPGYYSDKSVLSRKFVLENVCFQTFTFFGAVYYNDYLRNKLQSNFAGHALELLFLFLPYTIIRPLYPRTQFSVAGSNKNGRSEKNKKFYEIGTTAIKIFYLWGKYFLGFGINFFIFLEVASEDNMRFIRGMYLLNVGTVSISVFLHTLRFKKVFPPKLTFSIYLGQIYATFIALPFACRMFTSHPKILLVTLAGLLLNLTRRKNLHFIWGITSLYLMEFTSIEW